jgi:glucosylceramidase
MSQLVLQGITLENEVRACRYATALIPDEKEVELSVVNLYPRVHFQTVEGFGAALTEAAGYVLSRMSEAKRREVLDACYGPEGLRYTLGRVPIDSCDFSLSPYCAAVQKEGAAAAGVSLARDEQYIQPLIRAAQQAAGAPISLLLSPWSPPAWMKDTGARNGGGSLKTEEYARYAAYLADYLAAYRAKGFAVRAMTIQNEPLAVQTWDSCRYTAAQEKKFLQEALWPALQARGLGDVEIYIWDHNKERVYERACAVLDENTAKMVAGVAFHWYSGDHFDALRLTREQFPDLKLVHSEGCVELTRWGADAGSELEQAWQYAHDMAGDFAAGMNSWIDWNLVLDRQGGPYTVGNYCGAAIHCDPDTDTVCYKPVYAAIGQFSRYIRPGAVRIGSSCCAASLEQVAFRNPDGSIAAVLLNRGPARPINLRMEGNTACVPLPAQSICTLTLPARA